MNNSVETILLYTIAAGFLSIVYGYFTGKNILNSSSGNAKMQEIASAIQIGAKAYLDRQYKTIAIVGLIVLIIVTYFFNILVGLGYFIGAFLSIFGNDWPTSDGTPVRDFVHVLDLADALIKSLTHLDKPGHKIINLGTATGSTVLEVVKAAEIALGRDINFKFADKRAGDSYALVTSNKIAKEILGWQPIKSLANILEDANAELLANS